MCMKASWSISIMWWCSNISLSQRWGTFKGGKWNNKRQICIVGTWEWKMWPDTLQIFFFFCMPGYKYHQWLANSDWSCLCYSTQLTSVFRRKKNGCSNSNWHTSIQRQICWTQHALMQQILYCCCKQQKFRLVLLLYAGKIKDLCSRCCTDVICSEN